MLLFAAASLAGLFWMLRLTAEQKAAGSEDVGIGIGFSIFFGIITLIFLLVFVISMRRALKGRSAYIAQAAAGSGLSITEIERFEEQAVSQDSLVLKLSAGLDRIIGNEVMKDGILTADYILLPALTPLVFRVDSLRAACFVDYVYKIGEVGHKAPVHNLAVALIGANGCRVYSDCTREAGLELMRLLGERNRQMEIRRDETLSEDAYELYCKKILG